MENTGKFSAKKVFSKYGILIAFIILFIALSIASPVFLSVPNMLNVLRQISVNGVMAVGMTFVVMTGGIDLSVGSVLALSACIGTYFATNDMNVPVIVAVLIGLLIGCICGAFNGFFVAKMNVAAFIVTLAMTTIARGAAMVFTNGSPVINLKESYTVIGNGALAGKLPYPIIFLIVVVAVGAFLLHFTKYGRHVFAVGGNETAAKASGINVGLVKFSVYLIMGFLAGLAGVILSSRVMTGQPAAGNGYELDAIAAAVIGGASLSGGIGSIFGTVIGMLIIGFLSNGLDLLNVSSYWQQIVKGAIILAAVLMDRKKASN